jgi:hypothetical protein
VATALDLAKWAPETRIAGDRLSLSDVVELASTVCGVDLDVTKLPVEGLVEILSAELEEGEKFYYQLLLAIAVGRMNFEPNSEDIFNDIEPMSVKEYFRKYWTKDENITM